MDVEDFIKMLQKYTRSDCGLMVGNENSVAVEGLQRRVSIAVSTAANRSLVVLGCGVQQLCAAVIVTLRIMFGAAGGVLRPALLICRRRRSATLPGSSDKKGRNKGHGLLPFAVARTRKDSRSAMAANRPPD